MNFEHKLQLVQQQKLLLTPELKMAITILQLPLLELEPYLEQQLQENPVLEIDVSEKEDVSLEDAQKEQNTEEWLEYFSNKSDLGTSRQYQEKIYLEEAETSLPDLDEFLREQAMLVFNEEDTKNALFIIENINEHGYLTISDAEVTAELNISIEKYLDVLKRIQQFEPAGVGARSISECLAIQIRQKCYPADDEIILLSLVEGHLEFVAEGKVALLARKFKILPERIQHYFDIIKKLNPHPGASYSSKRISYISPDITIEKISGEFIIIVNDAALPRFLMSETYLGMLKTEKDDGVRKYIQKKINSATWIIKSIEQRRLTLYKVANTILELQYDFFEYGKSRMKPLVLRQVAEIIDMHESTVSRAVANKYIQTPHGVFSLKYFFTGGLSTSDGVDTAVSAIKESIRKLFSLENEKNPLSDQKIADILLEQGINISRRTVTKYREEMRILSSAKRKRY